MGRVKERRMMSTQECIAGLPWWRSSWESACQCRGRGFEPCSGTIPHAVERLGPWATIAEPARLEPVLRNKRGRDSERPAHRDEEWPLLATTRESPRAETKTHTAINKQKECITEVITTVTSDTWSHSDPLWIHRMHHETVCPMDGGGCIYPSCSTSPWLSIAPWDVNSFTLLGLLIYRNG